MFLVAAYLYKQHDFSLIAIDMQDMLPRVEGISLLGLQAYPINLQALSRMPQLRILILDGTQADTILSGFNMPRLAMLSWRDAHGPSLPFALQIATAAAVIDISGSNELKSLPDSLQVCCPTLSHIYCQDV